jgi:5-methylcytosine-specific restriction endonuclease McrA
MATLNKRKEDLPKTRKNNKAFYQTERWHRFSREYRKAHRLCVMCLKEENKPVISQCVDHITPLVEWPGDPYDLNNLQALCFRHHNQKTAQENKGWNKR